MTPLKPPALVDLKAHANGTSNAQSNGSLIQSLKNGVSTVSALEFRSFVRFSSSQYSDPR